MASVKRSHRVPPEISKPDWRSVGIRDGKTVVQDPGSYTLPLVGREQVELIKTQMIGKTHGCDGADGPPVVHDPGEWRVPEPLLMEVSLEALIPSPSGQDVRAQSRAFDLKSEVSCLGRMWKSVKADVRGQIRNIHWSIVW
jgi:hypothetical protein